MISIMADREKAAVEVEGVADDSMQGMRLDRHGLPLVPQPSDRKDDPLVCHNPLLSFSTSLSSPLYYGIDHPG